MWAGLLELMRGLQRRSFLNWGSENLQLQWKPSLRPHVPGEHMCKTNSAHKTKAGGVRSRVRSLREIKQTNKQKDISIGRAAAWTGLCFSPKRMIKGVGFFSTFRGRILDQTQSANEARFQQSNSKQKATAWCSKSAVKWYVPPYLQYVSRVQAFLNRTRAKRD